jgi:hypothetical protein
MNNFLSALWTETLKVRRSKVPFFAAIGFSIVPLIGGFFMIILKDPEAAKSMGLISAKAQLTVGVADWTAFFGLITLPRNYWHCQRRAKRSSAQSSSSLPCGRLY